MLRSEILSLRSTQGHGHLATQFSGMNLGVILLPDGAMGSGRPQTGGHSAHPNRMC